MKKSILILLTLCGTLAFAQKKVSGFVYEDANQNGKKERKEKGLAKVSVSNGIQVVQTDENGKYELPLSDDNQIFVIKPSGYAFAIDEFNLPKFYVTHKPNGSPDADFKYKAVAPTGKLPKSVDFGMVAQNESKDFSAFLFGDPQPYSLEELEYFRKAIVTEAANNKNGVLLGISLGDLVGDNLSYHPPYKEVMKEMGLPWYNVIGNHDMNYEAKEDLYSDETFELNFGPANYAFNYGEAHFLILDDIIYPDPRDGKGYWGGFRPDQIEFVQNNLKFIDKDKLIVISFHIPLFVGDEQHFHPESRQQLFDLLKDYPNILLLSAHTHFQTNQFYTEEKGWKGAKPLHEYNVGTTSGDWYSGEFNENGVPVSTMRDGTPVGYAFLNIKGNQYELDYKVVGKPLDYKMEIYAPKVVADKGWNTAMVFANVFMGTENDKVEIRFDDGEWKPMVKVKTEDPSYYAAVQKWDLSETLLTGRRPSNPVESSHIWSAKISNKLGVGNHKIEIKITDMFGRTFSDTETYRIEAKK